MGPAMSTTFELYSLPNLILPHFRHEYAAKLAKTERLKTQKSKRNHLKETTKLRSEIGILITKTYCHCQRQRRLQKILVSVSQNWISENSTKGDPLSRQGAESLKEGRPPPNHNPLLGQRIIA